MITCSQCSGESPQGSQHCVHCGARLDDAGPARTVMGMPALKPLAGLGAPKTGGLLAGLPALRTKSSSPLVSSDLSLKAGEGVEASQRTVVGLPLFEGARKATEPVDAEAPTVGMPGVTDDQLAAASTAEEPAATLAMQGLTDAELAAAEPAATLVMQGLSDAQVEAAQSLAAAPRVESVAVPAEPAPKALAERPAAVRDDRSHHPQRTTATSATRLGKPKRSPLVLILTLVAVAGGAFVAWYFLR